MHTYQKGHSKHISKSITYPQPSPHGSAQLKYRKSPYWRISARIVRHLLRQNNFLYSCTTHWNSERPVGAVMHSTGPPQFLDGSFVLTWATNEHWRPCGTSGGGLRLSGRSPTCRLRGESTIRCPTLCLPPRHNPSGYDRSTL